MNNNTLSEKKESFLSKLKKDVDNYRIRRGKSLDVLTEPLQDKEGWEKEFDDKFIMPESHLGKKYWKGGYTPRVWGKYQDMKEVKKFISKQIQLAVLEERDALVKKIEKVKIKDESEEIKVIGSFPITAKDVYNQAIDDVLSILLKK